MAATENAAILLTGELPLNNDGDAASLYLDLMKRCLTRMLFLTQDSREIGARRSGTFSRSVIRLVRQIGVPLYGEFCRRLPAGSMAVRKIVGPIERELKRRAPVDWGERASGRDWPADAETMIGLARLDNIQHCVTEVIRNGIPGDLMETGVWRGGATIFMRAILKAYGVADRIVWVADSFRGLPRPDAIRVPEDAGDTLWAFNELAVSVDEVRANFARYNLLDEQVHFLVGWFRDTLPAAPISRLAVLRLDGDMYESTIDSIRALYPKLSVGGYVIVDDYGNIPACRAAIQNYRNEQGITDPIVDIDGAGVFWQRTR